MTEAIHIEDPDRLTGIRTLLSTIMEKAGIDAVLVPARLAVKNRIMPLLVSDPERLTEADPFAPAFPLNAAQQLAKLTRMPAGCHLAAFLRPCEIRAFNELVKLNQGRRDDVILIAMDCPGALSNADFRTYMDRFETADDATQAFCEAVVSGDGMPEVASACRACTHFLADGADIAIAASASTYLRFVNAGLETFVPGLLAVSPDVVIYSTGGTHAAIRDILGDDAANTTLETIADALSVGRVGTADEVAKAVVFLIDNGFVNGISLDRATFEEALIETATRVQGAYSMILLTGKGEVIGLKDPHGFRPLALGRRFGAPLHFGPGQRKFAAKVASATTRT